MSASTTATAPLAPGPSFPALTYDQLFKPCEVCGLKGCERDHAALAAATETSRTAELQDLTLDGRDRLDRLDLEQLTARFRRAFGAFSAVGRKNLELAYDLGLVLERVRAVCGKGKWLGWCEAETLEGRTAQRYIKFRQTVGSRDNLSHLPADASVRGALVLLAETKQAGPAVAPTVFPVALPSQVRIRELDAALPPTEWAGSVDLVVTSWPYGLGKTEHGYLDYTDYAAWRTDARRWADALLTVLAARGRVCLVLPIEVRLDDGPRPMAAHVVAACESAGLVYETAIVWSKSEHGQTSNALARGSVDSPNAPCVTTGDELILVFHVGEWNLDRPSDESDTTREEFLRWRNGHWLIKGRSDPAYPCVFPLELAERLIKLYSFPGDLVADFHVGSGTTAVQAALLGRRFVGGDLNGYAVALATQRVAAALRETGDKEDRP